MSNVLKRPTRGIATFVVVLLIALIATPSKAEPLYRSVVYQVTSSAGNSTVEIIQPDKVACTDTQGKAEFYKCQLVFGFKYSSGPTVTFDLALVDDSGQVIPTESPITISPTKWSGAVVVRFNLPGNKQISLVGSPTDSSVSVATNFPTRISAFVSGIVAKEVSGEVAAVTAQSSIKAKFAQIVLKYNNFPFAVLSYPSEMYVKTDCVWVPITVAQIDFSNGQINSAYTNDIISVGVHLLSKSDDEVLTANDFLDFASDKAISTGQGLVCGLDAHKGHKSSMKITIEAGWDPVSTHKSWIQYPTLNTEYSVQVSIVGMSAYYELACQSHGKISVYRSPSAKCPSGSKRVLAKIVNGKAVKSTILCLKGLESRAVSGYAPVCPAGFKRSI